MTPNLIFLKLFTLRDTADPVSEMIFICIRCCGLVWGLCDFEVFAVTLTKNWAFVPLQVGPSCHDRVGLRAVTGWAFVPLQV